MNAPFPRPADRPREPAAPGQRDRGWVRAAGIAGAYAGFAALWIYFSDRALAALLDDPQLLVQVSVYKGLGFVLVTTVLLLLLLRRAFGATAVALDALRVQEAEVRRLNRLYAALSQINQAIVRTPGRDELFRRLCGVLVETGGFGLAWVGWHDPATRRLVPVAVAGDGQEYVRNLQVYSDDRPEGRGPSGQAFRSDQPAVSADLHTDPTMTPWRQERERCGLRSSAAFPIRLGGAVAGVLSVYAPAAGFFQDKEIALLQEAVADVSFALDNLVREEERRRAEERAHHERLFSDTMLDAMPGILYFYDFSGRFLRWNRNFERVSGYPAAAIATMHPLDFFRPEDRPLVEARIGEVFTAGESSVEAPFRRRDGATIPHFFTGRRVEYGGHTCLVGVGIDVTERQAAERALQASEHRHRTTLDNILEGCQLIGFDGRYLYLNDAAAGHNRRANAELLGRPLTEAWPGIGQTRVFALIERGLKERLPAQEEVEFAFVAGGRGWFDVRVQPVDEGVLVLSIDLTQRRQAELALRVLNQTLELEVAGRTAELESARGRAEAADRLKSAFLATMSHELRTPLNSIIGFTGILLQGLAGPLNAEQSRQLGMVKGSARHLLELINDVLDISKIEAGQLTVQAEPFDLAAAVERVLASVRPLAEKKGLALVADVPPHLPPLLSDRRRVEQILLNLLNNALKFTERGQVTLTVETLAGFQATPEAPPVRAVRLRVTDTGIGIRAEDLVLLFQPFRQLDTGLTRQHEGTGLGLAICHRLAGLLGGRMSVVSEWSHGSEFAFTVPLTGPTQA